MNDTTASTFNPVERPAPLPETLTSITPGELIRREIGARGITQAELSARTGLSTKHVNQVIKDVVPLSAETALLIERAIGVSADLLSALEAKRESKTSRQLARNRLGNYAEWFSDFPLDALARNGIIDRRDEVTTQIDGLLSFFGLADPDAFERIYADSLVSFRRAQHLDVNARATAVWLRLAEKEAEKTQREKSVPPFDRKQFLKLLDELPSLTKEPIKDALKELQERSLREGVHVVLLPELPGTRACAATSWVGDRPVIVLSGRGKTQDGLWFNFFHEAGHTVLHPKRRSAVQLDKTGDDVDGHESEANKFARDCLLRHRDPSCIKRVTTREQAIALAQDLGVDPGIIAGQAAHEHGTWAIFSKIRKPLKVIPD